MRGENGLGDSAGTSWLWDGAVSIIWGVGWIPVPSPQVTQVWSQDFSFSHDRPTLYLCKKPSHGRRSGAYLQSQHLGTWGN